MAPTPGYHGALARVGRCDGPGMVAVRDRSVSPAPFAALLIATAFAIAGIGPARARSRHHGGPAMLAVTIGLSVRRETLSALGSHWPAVVSVTITTLFLSARAGLRLSRQRDVGAVTGVLAMIAGGATGLVAVAHDLGADERLVVITQHLRVVLTRCPPGRVSLSCRLVLSIVDPWARSVLFQTAGRLPSRFVM